MGVGLLYGAGYFKQALNRDGWQVETYPVLDPDGLPLTLVREPDGRPAGHGTQVAVLVCDLEERVRGLERLQAGTPGLAGGRTRIDTHSA